MRQPTSQGCELMRMDKDQLGLLLAQAWSRRGTCARRQVGCVLFDARGQELGTGYNGPASGVPHCVDVNCPGALFASGQGLDACEAIHAEANALIRCRSVDLIHTAYVTNSPCLHCVKLLMNTSCRRIVFATPYAHDEAARLRWTSGEQGALRTWEHVKPAWSIEQLVLEGHDRD